MSATEPSLREKFTMPPQVEPVGDPSNLGAGAETQLARLMMSEIHGLRFLERDQGYLVLHRMLTSVVAYSMLKRDSNNELTKEGIRMFLEQNGYSPTQGDIEGIFSRLDHNKDGKVTYADFS